MTPPGGFPYVASPARTSKPQAGNNSASGSYDQWRFRAPVQESRLRVSNADVILEQTARTKNAAAHPPAQRWASCRWYAVLGSERRGDAMSAALRGSRITCLESSTARREATALPSPLPWKTMQEEWIPSPSSAMGLLRYSNTTNASSYTPICIHKQISQC